jgi:hypothetical protein
MSINTLRICFSLLNAEKTPCVNVTKPQGEKNGSMAERRTVFISNREYYFGIKFLSTVDG